MRAGRRAATAAVAATTVKAIVTVTVQGLGQQPECRGQPESPWAAGRWERTQVADWDTVTLSVTVTGTVPGCHGLASQVDWQVKLGLTDSDACSHRLPSSCTKVQNHPICTYASAYALDYSFDFFRAVKLRRWRSRPRIRQIRSFPTQFQRSQLLLGCESYVAKSTATV